MSMLCCRKKKLNTALRTSPLKKTEKKIYFYFDRRRDEQNKGCQFLINFMSAPQKNGIMTIKILLLILPTKWREGERADSLIFHFY